MKVLMKNNDPRSAAKAFDRVLAFPLKYRVDSIRILRANLLVKGMM
jgi:hypothetical protein